MSSPSKLRLNRAKVKELASPQDGTWMKFRVKVIPRSKRGLKNLRIFLKDGVHLTYIPNAKKQLQPGLRGVFMWPHLKEKNSVKVDVVRPITTQNLDALTRLAKRTIIIESANLERKPSSAVLYPQHNHSTFYQSVGPTLTARSVGRRIEQELDLLSKHPQLVPNGPRWAQLSPSCRAHLANVRNFPRRLIRVGIIDSGLSDRVRQREFGQRSVVIQHFDEDGKITGDSFEDFDSQKETNGHGSSCSVILAGNTLGVDPKCELSVAAITKCLTENAFAEALKWLVRTQLIEVLSISLCSQDNLGVVDGQVIGGPSPNEGMRQCFDKEVNGNWFGFAAVGNFNRTNGHTGGLCGSPADSQHAFSVGSLHVMGTTACETSLFSVVREKSNSVLKSVPEFIAAGENVETLDKMTRRPKSRIGGSTSHACPQVAGIASLILSRFPQGALSTTDLTILLEVLGVRFPVSVTDHEYPSQTHNVSPIKLVSFR
ncbi:MAG: Subtilase family [Schlesneria sp.]|nr:Subtilase family [Schlesneria sp.]